MNKKEQWASEIMQSLDGMQRAEPKTDLFAKITAQLPVKKQAKIVPLKHLRWIAAVACAIIAVNIYVFDASIKSKKQTTYSQSMKTNLVTNYYIYN